MNAIQYGSLLEIGHVLDLLFNGKKARSTLFYATTLSVHCALRKDCVLKRKTPP